EIGLIFSSKIPGNANLPIRPMNPAEWMLAGKDNRASFLLESHVDEEMSHDSERCRSGDLRSREYPGNANLPITPMNLARWMLAEKEA
ncbi:MAG: hypothetical protein ACOC29_01325, partial [Candidatus Sumerlaeota bacterium]